MLPVWAKGFVGGGDAKLLIALASGLSFPEFVRTLFDMVVAGGALGCLYLVLSRLPMALPSYSGPNRLRHALDAERRRILTRESIPYGVAIALGWIFAVVPHRLEGAAWPFVS
jgi:prepilin peptidase CpaA